MSEHERKEQAIPPAETQGARQPGDPTKDELIARVIRVDHAGEFGATRIYEGQLAVLGRAPAARAIRRMAAQERQHLEAFEKLMGERAVRPTALQPFWHLAGFALGAATAALGPKAAMACTVAVEEVIETHYQGQLGRLGTDEPELRETIARFRDDEIKHKDEALKEGALDAPGYEPLSAAIRAGTRLAIWLSERI